MKYLIPVVVILFAGNVLLFNLYSSKSAESELNRKNFESALNRENYSNEITILRKELKNLFPDIDSTIKANKINVKHVKEVNNYTYTQKNIDTIIRQIDSLN